MKEEDIRKRDVLNRYLQLVEADAQDFFSDRTDFQLVKCPACGSSHGQEEFSKFGFQYVSCGQCDTLFVNPRPDPRLLDRFYTDSPSTKFWINEFFKPVAEARREKIFKPRAEQMLNRFGTDPGWTVGDIGAGFGLFLLEMKECWPQSRMIAIEPSPEQAAICRGGGLEVIESTIESVPLEKGGFDLLVAFELLEHLYEPRILIRKAFDLLKQGGWLYLTTLNGLGFDIQILWEKSKAVFPPHHLNFFNTHSLPKLLADCCFRVEEIATPGRLDFDIVEGMIIKDQIDAGRFWNHVARCGMQKSKQELQDWITRNNMSSHMSILAQKR